MSQNTKEGLGIESIQMKMGLPTAFDGSNRTARLNTKGLIRGDPDSIAVRELETLWQRSHHLCRNNSAVVTARNRLLAHWVGAGIKVKWDNKKVELAWKEFAANPSIDGFGTIANLQNLWGSALFESGEVFTRMIIKKDRRSLIPLKLQVIEAEQLDVRLFRPPNTRNGIEFDKNSMKPVAYHFWKYHPSILTRMKTNKRISIPSKSILHIFNRERPGQWRGTPKVAPAILALYEMDELSDATLVRQKVAQAVGWIVKKRELAPLPQIGEMEKANKDSTDIDETKIQKIKPGGIHYLQDDEDFEFAQIDDIGTNFVPLLEYNWRCIAGCLDVTYEQLTGDISKANFSSIRSGLIEFRKRVSLIQQLLFLNLGMIPLTNYFKELCSIYINKEAGNARPEFTFPKQDWVDPLKDAQADILEVRAGFATLREKLAERGVEDIESHIMRVAEEQDYNVILTSNPKKMETAENKPTGEKTNV